MKKFLMLGVAALTMAAAAPAMAEHHEGAKHDMFAKHDTNSDGMISQEEFMATAQEKFAKMDADKNGSISKEEADAMKEKWKEKMKEHRAKKDAAPAPEPDMAE